MQQLGLLDALEGPDKVDARTPNAPKRTATDSSLLACPRSNRRGLNHPRRSRQCLRRPQSTRRCLNRPQKQRRSSRVSASIHRCINSNKSNK